MSIGLINVMVLLPLSVRPFQSNENNVHYIQEMYERIVYVKCIQEWYVVC